MVATASDQSEGATSHDLPLSGVRVLELGRFLAAPLAAQLLGDLGAEVVKIERPGEGDEFRTYGLTSVKDADGNSTSLSSSYVSANRNKRSLTVDFSAVEGQKIVRALADRCDIFIENFKAGGLAKYGLDYETLRQSNPGLIYLSVTGFGQTGPYANRPATDSVFQAMSGLWYLTGEPDGEPEKVGIPAVDYITGVFGGMAVLAALRHRDKTGQGQQIDLSLLDCGMAFVAPRTAQYLIDQSLPGRIGNRTPGVAPGQLFECSDGSLMIQAGTDRQFGILCAAMERRDLLDDPRFASSRQRQINIEPLVAELERTFATRSSREWSDILGDRGIITAPIYDIPQCFADPQIQERGMRVTIPNPAGAPLDIVANPMRFSETPIETYTMPPALGEDTDDVLSAWLDYDAAQIEALRANGTV